MGVVYSPEEVAHGQVARPGDHAKLGQLLLSEAKNSDAIKAGIVYGSTVCGMSNMRSDVDFFAIYGEGEALAAYEKVRAAKEYALQTGIYAKAEEHWEPEHPFVKPGQVDKQYLNHFSRVVRRSPGWAIGDPMSYIDQTPLNRDELLFSIRGYISAKTAKFTKASCDLNPDYHNMQRALELPVAIARKVLLVMDPHHDSPIATEKKQAVRQVIDAALTRADMVRLPGVKEILEEQKVLSNLDTAYSLTLSDAVSDWNSHRSNKGYEKWLIGHSREMLERAFLLSFSWQRLVDSIE